MRRAPSIVALLVALAAVTVLGVLLAAELRRSIPATTPRVAIEQAAAEREQARQAEFAKGDSTWDVAYDPGMVRDEVTWEAAGYPRTVDVALVNATPGADLTETATECARRHGTEARVQCYVFASTEAYEFKDISGGIESSVDLPISNLCYGARATSDRAGGPLQVIGPAELAEFSKKFGCPESWNGRDEVTA